MLRTSLVFVLLSLLGLGLTQPTIEIKVDPLEGSLDVEEQIPLQDGKQRDLHVSAKADEVAELIEADPVVTDDLNDSSEEDDTATAAVSHRQKRFFWPFTSLFGYDYYDYGYPPPYMHGGGFHHRPGFGMGGHLYPPRPMGGGFGFGFGLG